MLPVIENNELPFKKYIFSESGYTRSVSDGTFKYIAFRYPERMVKAMKEGELNKAPTQLDSFDHPFDLSPCEFMDSELYWSLVDKSSQRKLDEIVWFERDWGTIIWPPEE